MTKKVIPGQGKTMLSKKMERKINASPYDIALLLLACILVLAVACSQHKQQKLDANTGRKQLPGSKLTLLSQLQEKDKPKVILLDTVPKPSLKNVSIRERNVGSGTETGSEKQTQKISLKVIQAIA